MTTDTKTPLLERIPYQAILLGACAAIAAALLLGVDNATREPIAQRKMEDLQQSLAQVVPDDLHDNNMVAKPLLLQDADGKEVKIYQGTKAGKVTALVWETVGFGMSLVSRDAISPVRAPSKKAGDSASTWSNTVLRRSAMTRSPTLIIR